jgi:MarR family transcriptional regulator for hemolysin
LFERTESIGHLVNWAARLFARDINIRIKPFGISAGQLPVLLSLADGSVQSQKALVQRSATEQSTMAATLARMEKHGLVFRSEHPNDGRASLFSLTPHGRSLLKRLYAALEEGNLNATKDFQADERAVLIGLVQRIIANLSCASSIQDIVRDRPGPLNSEREPAAPVARLMRNEKVHSGEARRTTSSRRRLRPPEGIDRSPKPASKR